MTIDLCIPTYNEEAVIDDALAELDRVLPEIPNATWRLIVADNGSTDATAERATRHAGVEVLHISEKGKGAAIIAAARASTADLFGFIDVDLSADPRDLALLIRAIEEGADIAIGSRLLRRDTVHRSRFRTLSSVVFNMLRRLLIGIKVEDTQCGLKLMNDRGRALLRLCQETGWFFDMELLARAERAGLVTREIPVHWEEQRFAGRESKLHLFSDVVPALKAMLRIRRRLTHNPV